MKSIVTELMAFALVELCVMFLCVLIGTFHLYVRAHMRIDSSWSQSIYYVVINMETKGSVNHTLIVQRLNYPLSLSLSPPSQSFSVVAMPRTYQYILFNVILKACLLCARVKVDMRYEI